MATLPESVDYTDKDFDALRARLIALIKSVPDWSDFDVASFGNADLVRTSFESMTRVMEAMQRAQIERERAIADRERAVTDAQVANNRSNVELTIALIDHATGGKPQDPVVALDVEVPAPATVAGHGRAHRLRQRGADAAATGRAARRRAVTERRRFWLLSPALLLLFAWATTATVLLVRYGW